MVSRLAGVTWPPRDAPEGTRFIQYAERERLFPLLLEESDLPDAVRGVLPQFRALDALHRRKYEVSRVGLVELIRVVGAESFVLLKGSDYRFRLYPKPALRPVADLDFFVPRDEVARVIGLLSDAGYGQVYSSHGAQWSRRFYEYKCTIGDMHVELHRAFMQSVRARVPYEAVWQRREPFDGDGYRAFRLGHDDALLHHAVSMAKDEFSTPLIRYVDMYLFLRHPASDLRACVEAAREWESESALYGALRLTLSLFPELHDSGAEAAMLTLLSNRQRTFLDRRVLPDPRSEPSGHQRGRRVQLWRKFWLMDRGWRRVAFFGNHVWTSAVGYMREWMTGKNWSRRPDLNR